MGPLWLDVEGYELDAEDKEILAHPTVGGVILFARNYHDNEQLIALNHAIRQAAKRPILIGVDQEGGRVQRFRDGFTKIPPAQAYAEMENGVEAAELGGWLMAAELIAHDIDLSFAPVLDQSFQCKAIGSRAFGEDLDTILTYSSAYMKGMKQVGMATTGKHFPGHGGVIVDSHYETPFDNRSDIFENDMAIFKAQIDAGILDAMMPAHVVYPNYDEQPASGSPYWLKEVLRNQLDFKGIVFSDDLNMEGATIMGGPAERSLKSMQSGCDMVLMCNNRLSAVEVLDNLPIVEVPQAMNLLKQQSFSLKELQTTERWQKANRIMNLYWDSAH
ncbi:beta-N-acetylhexosaminidase [Vibrio algivorus]|uniref:Beta-hexosaminidase n=1 Tax=Vibrio algivorus TaxID=1667024 RepID=A0ABQ6EKT5_9VIBR|nr:beta-N-acetylhexosaminidase [Vibrio algivorus]GLT13738.1 beta-hexosaminidase [Vibrio algivorus]